MEKEELELAKNNFIKHAAFPDNMTFKNNCLDDMPALFVHIEELQKAREEIG